MDILFELGPVNTRNRPTVRSASIAGVLAKQVRERSIDNRVERGVFMTLMGWLVVAERLASPVAAAPYEPLLLRLDDLLVDEKRWQQHNEVNEATNDLREAVVFNDRSADANLKSAVHEATLGAGKCSDNRRLLYLSFIPQRLVTKLGEGATGWIGGVVRSVRASKLKGRQCSALARPDLRGVVG